MLAINQLSNLGHHLIVVLLSGFYAWLHPFPMDSMDQDLFVPELVMGPAKRAAYDPPPVGGFSAVGVEHGTMGPWDHGNWAAKMGLHRRNATSTKNIVELRKRGIDHHRSTPKLAKWDIFEHSPARSIASLGYWSKVLGRPWSSPEKILAQVASNGQRCQSFPGGVHCFFCWYKDCWKAERKALME